MNATIDITGIAIKTPRLLLRPFRSSDLDDFYEYAKVDGVGQCAGWLPHKDKEESRTILRHFIERKKTFAIVLDGKTIGSLGVEKYEETLFPELSDLRGRELGFVLSKAYWGQGLMTECVQAVIDYLFDVEKLDFLVCGHFVWNTRSARVQEKCGFVACKSYDFETRMQTVEKSTARILYRRDWLAKKQAENSSAR